MVPSWLVIDLHCSLLITYASLWEINGVLVFDNASSLLFCGMKCFSISKSGVPLLRQSRILSHLFGRCSFVFYVVASPSQPFHWVLISRCPFSSFLFWMLFLLWDYLSSLIRWQRSIYPACLHACLPAAGLNWHFLWPSLTFGCLVR